MRRGSSSFAYLRRGRIWHMRFHKLRIAFSVTCGIAGVLLVVLWVRSYSWVDGYHQPVGHILCGGDALRGCISIHWIDMNKVGHMSGGYRTLPASHALFGINIAEPFLWFHFKSLPAGFTLYLPMWIPLVTIIGAAVAPWARLTRWRFSLRTLLIATTLTAILLGLIVWLSH